MAGSARSAALLSAALALAAGCGGSAAPAPSWRAPQLVAPARLTLRWDGLASGQARVDFLRPDGSKAPQGSWAVDLAVGGSVSASRRVLTVEVAPPLVDPTLVRLAPSAEGGPSQFTVDPGRLREELLTPLDRVTGSRLARLLGAAWSARLAYLRSVAGDPPGAALEGRRAVSRALEAAGLDPAWVAQFRGALPQLTPPGGGADELLGRRLWPLVAFEALMAPEDGLSAPWPPVHRAVGTSFQRNARMEGVPRWRALGSGRPVVKGRPQREVWLATEGMLRTMGPRGPAGSLVQGLATVAGVVGEAPTEWLLAVEIPFTVAAPPTTGPCRLALDVLRWSPTLALLASVNGAPERRLANAATADVPHADFEHLDSMRVVLALDPALVRPGRNVVALRVEQFPVEDIPLPLSVRSASLEVPPEGGGTR